MAEKVRLDSLLVKRGEAKSREEAKELILAGRVKVEGFPCDKASRLVESESKVTVEGDLGLRFVSRGGQKLDCALEHFKIDPKGLVALDAGISTGGFSDVLLRRGAKRVIGVDVGYGQLDWNLRNEPRLTLFERTNIKDLTLEKTQERADLVVADLSFISLTKVFAKLKELSAKDAEFVLLIKPQFEVGKKEVGKGGVVREARLHLKVLRDLYNFFTVSGAQVMDLIESPIKGSQGNREFLIHLSLAGQNMSEESFMGLANKIVIGV